MNWPWEVILTIVGFLLVCVWAVVEEFNDDGM